jgi:hypothetical protein
MFLYVVIEYQKIMDCKCTNLGWFYSLKQSIMLEYFVTHSAHLVHIINTINFAFAKRNKPMCDPLKHNSLKGTI